MFTEKHTSLWFYSIYEVFNKLDSFWFWLQEILGMLPFICIHYGLMDGERISKWLDYFNNLLNCILIAWDLLIMQEIHYRAPCRTENRQIFRRRSKFIYWLFGGGVFHIRLPWILVSLFWWSLQSFSHVESL